MSEPGEGRGEEEGDEVAEPGIAMLMGRQPASLGSARLIVISGWGDTALSLRVCTGWGLPGDCLGLGGAGGIFGPAVPIFRVPCCSDDVLFGLANVPEPILGVPGVTVPILGVPAPEILLSVEEGLVEVLLIPEPAGGRFEGLPALEGLLNGLQGEFALRALEAGFEGGLESCVI